MDKKIIGLFCLFAGIFVPDMSAGPLSIAGKASVLASSELGPEYSAINVTDGMIGMDGIGEWAAKARNRDYPWIRLTWEQPQNIERIVLYDRASEKENISGCRIIFSDGSIIYVNEIPSDGTAISVSFPGRKADWVQIEGIDGTGKYLGFSEIEVFPAPDIHSDPVDWVDPYIETNKGRYFYFITGNLPYGMASSAPLTRNCNQGGGGYNYNEEHIICFPQIHWWSMSGIGMMPVRADVNPLEGDDAIRSEFSHDDEIVQPGYHRVYLRTPGVWVEQTATDRVSMYRFTWTEDASIRILNDLGGFLGNSVMADASVTRVCGSEYEGHFNSVKRPWGGPEEIPVFFVVSFDRECDSFDGWSDGSIFRNIDSLAGKDAGVGSLYRLRKGEKLQMKIAFSLTSIENARNNLKTECPGWDFDVVRVAGRKVWNDWLSRIEVKGGSSNQRIKFYTDLWHVLLGRHKLNDVSGDYPDRTRGPLKGRITDAEFIVRTLPKNHDGTLKYNMYNFDAHWGAQWNLNIIWSLAYPEILDDFAASAIQYAENGGLLPRGPVGGGYSYIMRGNPAAHLVTAACMTGLMRKKPDMLRAFKIMEFNNGRDGMAGKPPQVTPEDIAFYEKNGYVPSNAGITLDLAFQDWAVAQVAKKLGRKSDYRKLVDRSHGWRALFDSQSGFVFPKDKDGNFIHRDPLSGKGWVETNAWQATFSVANDLVGLSDLMGGPDKVTAKLDSAFRLAEPDDFISEYHTGYVAYSNQPCLSNAHVFSYMGKPWLTQYWVRKVKEKAYGGVTPDLGYGGHDEDQGQMGGISALMAIGLFNIYGNESIEPFYEITSPVFDEVVIRLDRNYYSGDSFVIKTHDNSPESCYITKASLNGKPLDTFWFTHRQFSQGGTLDLWLSSVPDKEWGTGELPSTE